MSCQPIPRLYAAITIFRPLHISPLLSTNQWKNESDKTLNIIGVPSQVLIAVKIQ